MSVPLASLTNLMHAARRADQLTVRNHLITIELQGDGLIIKGERFDPDGKIYRVGCMFDWTALEDGSAPLVDAVERISGKLTESPPVEHTGNDAALSHPERDRRRGA